MEDEYDCEPLSSSETSDTLSDCTMQLTHRPPPAELRRSERSAVTLQQASSRRIPRRSWSSQAVINFSEQTSEESSDTEVESNIDGINSSEPSPPSPPSRAILPKARAAVAVSGSSPKTPSLRSCTSALAFSESLKPARKFAIHASSPPIVQLAEVRVTIAFLRDENGILFHKIPSTLLSAVEWAIHFSSSLEKHNSRLVYEGYSERRSEEEIKKCLTASNRDRLYTATFASSQTIADVKNHIRRLLNVFFSHPNPECLELRVEFYDEQAPHAGELMKPGHSDHSTSLLDLLDRGTTEKAWLDEHELLGVVTGLKKSDVASFCSRESWASISSPPIWKLFVQSNNWRRRGKPFWEHTIETKRNRTVADIFSTEMLLTTQGGIESTCLDSQGGPLKTAVLFGVGLGN